MEQLKRTIEEMGRLDWMNLNKSRFETIVEIADLADFIVKVLSTVGLNRNLEDALEVAAGPAPTSHIDVVETTNRRCRWQHGSYVSDRKGAVIRTSAKSIKMLRLRQDMAQRNYSNYPGRYGIACL